MEIPKERVLPCGIMHCFTMFWDDFLIENAESYEKEQLEIMLLVDNEISTPRMFSKKEQFSMVEKDVSPNMRFFIVKLRHDTRIIKPGFIDSLISRLLSLRR